MILSFFGLIVIIKFTYFNGYENKSIGPIIPGFRTFNCGLSSFTFNFILFSDPSSVINSNFNFPSVKYKVKPLPSFGIPTMFFILFPCNNVPISSMAVFCEEVITDLIPLQVVVI